MDPGALHQFHNARNEHVPSVADSIHFHFLATDIMIHQHRFVRVHFHGVAQVFRHLFFIRHDGHGPPAQHKARPHQHRIADFLCRPDTILHVRDRPTLRLGNLQGRKQFFKAIPVLRPVDRFTVCPDNSDAPLMQRHGKVHRRLAAQCHDDALRLLQVQDVHDILRTERFKIKLIGTGIVRGNRFRVVVDYNGLIPGLPDRIDCMNRGVIKLHSLADPDGAGAKHNDLLPVGNHRFVFLFVCGIEIRNIACEFGSAGIDHFIYRHNAGGFPQAENILFTHTPEPADLPVGKAVLFGFPKHVRIFRPGCQRLFSFRNVSDLSQEEAVNLCCLRDRLNPAAEPEQFCDRENPVIRTVADIGQQVLFSPAVKLF